MFCLVMRHMHHRVNYKGFSFADDATFLITGRNEEEMKQNIFKCLDEFDKFCKSLNIKLNIGKTLYIYDKDLNLSFRGEKIEREQSSRVLGVRICSQVGNKSQLTHLLNQLNLTHVMVNGYQSHCDIRMVKILINSHGHGKINHGCAYFRINPSGEYIKLQNKINKIINKKFTRTILSNFYFQLGLINDETNQSMFFEARGRRLIELDLKDLEEYAEYIRNIEGTGFERTFVEKRMERLRNFHAKSAYRTLSRTEMKIIKNAIKERDRIRIEYPHYNRLDLPQWMFLKTSKIISVQNNIRKNQMVRFGTIIIRGNPQFELEEILEFATDRFLDQDGRLTSSYPYFRSVLRRDMNSNSTLIKECTPELWFEEYKRLPMNIRRAIRTVEFLSQIKNYYEKRCQHAENGTTLCENCEQPQNGYRINYDQARVREIQEIETEQRTVTEINDVTLKEYEIVQMRMDNEGHVIYNLNQSQLQRLQRRIHELILERSH